jgi:hypothetical protein
MKGLKTLQFLKVGLLKTVYFQIGPYTDIFLIPRTLNLNNENLDTHHGRVALVKYAWTKLSMLGKRASFSRPSLHGASIICVINPSKNILSRHIKNKQSVIVPLVQWWMERLLFSAPFERYDIHILLAPLAWHLRFNKET